MQLLCGLFALAGPGGLLKLVILFGDFFSTNFFHAELAGGFFWIGKHEVFVGNSLVEQFHSWISWGTIHDELTPKIVGIETAMKQRKVTLLKASYR